MSIESIVQQPNRDRDLNEGTGRTGGLNSGKRAVKGKQSD